MNKAKIFFLLIISLYAIHCEYLYKIDFYDTNSQFNPNETANKVHVMNGRYTTIKTIVKKHPSSQVTKLSSTVLSLSNEDLYVTAKENYKIDTRDAMEYNIDIGVPCNAQNPNITKIITLASTSEDFEVSPIEIVFTVEEPTSITLRLLMKQVPLKGIGFMYINTDKLKNVDQMTIKFTPTESTKEKAFADDFVIKPYQGKEEYGKIIYSKYGMVQDSNIVDQVFDISYENICFSGNKQLQFSYNKTIHTANPKDLIPSLVKKTNVVDNGFQSSINIEVTIDVAPVMGYCVLQDIDSQFISDEALLTHSAPVDLLHLQYNIDLYNVVGVNTISFYEVSQFLSYKMKCIFQPASSDTVTYQSAVVTFGYFDQADVKVTLDSDDIEPTSAHCITYIINSDIEESDFYTKAKEFCYDYFSRSDIARKDNGCIECVQRGAIGVYPKSENQKIISICAKSKDNCQTNYKGNFGEDFTKMVNEINTKEKIKENLNIDNVDIDKIYYEDDDSKPDKDKIKISDFSITNEEVLFKAYTTENKKIECYAIAQQRSDYDVSPYEFKQNFTLDNDSPSKTVSIKFPTADYDGMLYSLIFQCYNIPQFEYNFKRTAPFTIGQFIKEANAKLNDKIISPLSCTDESNKENEQCIQIKHHSLVELQTEIPTQQHLEGFKEFRNLSPEGQKKYLSGEVSNLSSIKTVYGVLDKIIFINELIAMTNCRTFIDFSECRNNKIENQNRIVTELNKYLKVSDIAAKLTDSDESIREKNIKIAMLSLFSMMNNPDAFSTNDTQRMIEILYNVYTHFDSILDLSSKQSVKSDVTKIFICAMNNLIDSFTFNEIENKLNIDNNTNFIKNINYTIVPEIISNITQYLSSIGESEMKLSNFNYQLIQFQKGSEKYQNISIDTISANLSIPQVISTKGDKVSIISYSRYPLLSFKKQKPSLSISVLDSSNKKVLIDRLSDNENIIINFTNLNSTDKFCYYFSWNEISSKKTDEDKLRDLGFKHEGVVTDQTYINNGSLACYTSHLTDFTVGSYDILGKIFTEKMNIWAIILLIVLSCAAGVVAVVLIVKIFLNQRKKDNNLDERVNSEIDSGQLIAAENESDA